MQYALIAAALVGAVAASPAWAPPAYGGSGDSWGSASTVDQTTVVTITSCGPEVTNCPANSATTYAVTTPASEVSPPAYTPETESSPVAPVTTSASGWGPPAYGSPSAPASVPASSPYSPEMPSSYESVPPPAATTPASSAPPAETPYSPVGGSAPPAYGSGVPSAPASPVYPVPGNGTWGAPSGTASGAPSASEAYPVQTGNTAAGLKAGSFLAGAGALAALLL